MRRKLPLFLSSPPRCQDNTPIPTVIDEADIPGVAEARAARNAGISDDEPEDQPILIPANINELGPDADDDGIIAVGDVPPALLDPNNVVVVDDDDVPPAAAPQEWDDNNLNNDNDTNAEDTPPTLVNPAHDDGEDSSDDEDEDFFDADDEAAAPRRSGRANKGKQGPRPYDEYLFFSQASQVNNCEEIPREEWMEWALGVTLVRYSIKAGLKKFGARGEKAVTKELKQLHDMITFFPVKAEELTKEERTNAIASLMFLKEKRNGDIKGRACADGRPQRELFEKQDATSPTVTTESIFLTSMIEALEGRDVACFDIPGAFLHAENDDEVIMLLKGRLAELLVMVEPALYRKYVSTNSKGEPMLYVRMHAALYGMLKSALLFYRKLVDDLEKDGFVINPYDPCVANKVVDGKQMTCIWHVDDLKVSHVSPDELTGFGAWLKDKYGDCKEHRGKIHDYLGMELDYTQPGKVMIRMVPYIQETIDEFPEEIIGTKTTPAAEYLFRIRDPSEAKALPEEQAMMFHRSVAKLVFIQARARRDIQTAVAFLTTRVKAPDEDDWGKLKRVLQYLKGTINMPLVLSAESMTLATWWIDASYAVHADCRGHTGAMASFGSGMPISFSRKQKLNTKSSTEAELVGVDDAMGAVLWTRYFLQEQGYDMKPSLIYQDNKSAMLLEENGRASSSKRTKHINVRYFFVHDRIKKGEIEVRHCPTEVMWGDINTKPRQGKGFCQFRAKLMGIEEFYNDEYERACREANGRLHENWLRGFENMNAHKRKQAAISKESMKNRPMTDAPSQECVGGDADKENMAPRGGRSHRGNTSVLTQKPTIKIVRGRRWSPNVYRNARLAGMEVDRAWRTAFVQ